MATLIPSLNQCLPRMQPGEKRFARVLEAKLEDDYLLWYDVPVGATGRHPDFIVLHPRRGLWVLEVKDWKRETLQSLSKERAVLLGPDGLKDTANPYAQARGYALDIVRLLERDPTLCASAGSHRGKLQVPWTYGVVLSNITRLQLQDDPDLALVLPPDHVICKDELAESESAERFQERLWAMQPWTMPSPLTLPQADRIRWHIFPELRLGGGQLDLFSAPDAEAAMPDLLRIMDLQQEQLARSLGEGHRVIHGVAGSGKTMILGFRCLHLAKVLRKPILVLCFNRTLSQFLGHLVAAKGLEGQVAVRTFHGWCHEQLRTYHAGLPPEGLPKEEYFEQMVQRVIHATDRGLIPRGQYGAILVDEGHDFAPEWLKLIAQMVSEETRSLLVLYDDAQSIYRRARFSFRSVGIQAQGRTTILRLNYRNTAEILAFAADFARDVLTPEEADEDGVPLLRPEAAGRHGPAPQVVELPSLSQELTYLAGHLRQLHDEGRPWKDMALLTRSVHLGERAAQQLERAGVPVQWVGQGRGRSALALGEDSVKVLTYHSSKGLEFPVVALPQVRRPEPENERAKDEARLLYVAMTRAVDRLVLTSSPAQA